MAAILMHLSSASPNGGGGTQADVGTLLIVHFKVLVFPHPWGIFFPAKSPVFGEAKHPTGFEDALQNFILVLWTIFLTLRLCILMKIEL